MVITMALTKLLSLLAELDDLPLGLGVSGELVHHRDVLELSPQLKDGLPEAMVSRINFDGQVGKLKGFEKEFEAQSSTKISPALQDENKFNFYFNFFQ